ncbi:hypothetical protein [Niabella hibiscisoli]|uniref:hypothetical protein n=1 Tax=Niabella hibiscisoli TaxID=1825928 RepID=UPI001F10B18D|nr:hypothetical protein [Niabella hibiscisoli]MCH5720944.1 hypothetical protein [Niabella hibiscisoli]
MTRIKILKGLALTSSTLLVIVFLCYRAGLFPDIVNPDSSLQTSPNGSSIQSNSIRSQAKHRDSVPDRRMLSSSKSMILAEPKKTPPIDLWKQKLKPKVLLTEQQIMSSSKSGIIVKPKTEEYNYKSYKKNTDTLIHK